MEINIGAVIVDEEIVLGSVQLDATKVYPELEDLIVTPTAEEQVFESKKYGYDKVTVKGADLREDLSAELTEQNNLLTTQEATIDDIVEALKDKAGVGIALQEKSAMPTTQEQNITADEGYTGLSAVKVAGDKNLVAENIKKDVEIFGVLGTAETAWDSSQLRKCYQMFEGNKVMEEAPYFNTTNVTSTYQMFRNCIKLKTLPNYDLSNVTEADGMFYNCDSLIKISLADLKLNKIDDLRNMFHNCNNLEEVILGDTSKVTSMYSAFYDSQSLKKISQFNGEKIYTVSDAFTQCYALTDFGGILNLGKGYTQKTTNNSSYSLRLHHSELLTHESLMNVINNLYDLNLTYDVANGGTLYAQQLVLGSDNLAKLTADEIAIATNKGWNVL
jgi:hypothetical protein